MNTTRVCPSCGKPLAADAPQGICPECLMKAGFGTASGTEGGGAAGFVPPTLADMVKLFPQLEILELVGVGGMGAVYKARQPGLDRLVALKILPPRIGGDPGFAERFTREARALAKLSHPNIVAVYDFGQADSLHYFIMEYVDGPNLRQVEQAGKFTPREAMQIIPQICEALQFAHDEGIVHRDIKPENVLLDKKGRVKIADFGLARILSREPENFRLTVQGQVMGTPNYMAPEQVEHPQAVDHRADIYSLGVVFYEMLTGELPLGKFAPPSRKVEVDVRLDDVVLRTLEKEPDRRYQHASQVKSDVETIVKSDVRTATSKSEPSRPVPARAARPAAEDAWQQVRGPAIGLVITGIVNWLTIPLVFLVTAGVLSQTSAGKGVLILIPVAALVLSSVMFLAGLKMKRLEAYLLAIVGSILAIITCPGNLVGLPLGIWALVVLARPEIRAAFAARAGGTLPSPPPTPAAPGSGAWKVAAGIVAAVTLLLAIPIGAILTAMLVPAWSRAKEHARLVANDSSRLAAVEKRLAREIEKGLRAGNCGFDSVSVKLTSLNDEFAECNIKGLKKQVSEGGVGREAMPLFETLSGGFDIRRAGISLWTLQGTGDLKNAFFTVDTFAELGKGAEAESRALKLSKSFSTSDPVISKDLMPIKDNAWSGTFTNAQTFRLFEVPSPGVGAEKCRITYEAKLKSEGLVGRAYLEMWCLFPGQGEHFSRGLDNVLTGSNDWATYQTPFFLEAGQKPNLIKLNLVVEGKGTVFIKDVKLMAAPLN